MCCEVNSSQSATATTLWMECCADVTVSTYETSRTVNGLHIYISHVMVSLIFQSVLFNNAVNCQDYIASVIVE